METGLPLGSSPFCQIWVKLATEQNTRLCCPIFCGNHIRLLKERGTTEILGNLFLLIPCCFDCHRLHTFWIFLHYTLEDWGNCLKSAITIPQDAFCLFFPLQQYNEFELLYCLPSPFVHEEVLHKLCPSECSFNLLLALMDLSCF